MFKLIVDSLRVIFSIDDRDLAIAFAEMEGFEILTEAGTRGKVPIGYHFSTKQHSPIRTIEPSQYSPGIWTYKIGYKRKIPPNPRIRSNPRIRKPRLFPNPRIGDYLPN